MPKTALQQASAASIDSNVVAFPGADSCNSLRIERDSNINAASTAGALHPQHAAHDAQGIDTGRWAHEVSASLSLLVQKYVDSGAILVRVLWIAPGGATHSRIEALCQRWLSHHGLLHATYRDERGLWIAIAHTESDSAFALCAALQNDLCIALLSDVFMALLPCTRDLLPLRAATLRALDDAAQAAQLLYATEPIVCTTVQRRRALTTFREALQSNRIHFKPEAIAQVHGANMEPTDLQICGYELLARIVLPAAANNSNGTPNADATDAQRPSRLLSTSEWITHVIDSHDSICLARQALLESQRWISAHEGDNTYVSINLTAINFLDPSLLEHILSLPQATRERLVLELTEWRDPRLHARLPAVIDTLRKHHLRISIDDFGAGYSSTVVLREMAFDIIKLDMHLTQSSKSSDHALIDWTLKVAAQNHSRVIAEGIETHEMLLRARALEIEYVQGWHVDQLLQHGTALTQKRD